MINYETNIDTVAIQCNFNSSIVQINKFKQMCNWIVGRRLGCLMKNKKKSNNKVHVYDLLNGGSKLTTIHTGFTRVRSKINGDYKKMFYIRIRWCGLKSFTQFDEDSLRTLLTVCAYLNTTCTDFNFVEFDIAIDMYCAFDNVLGIVASPASNVTYNALGMIQYYNRVPTSYLEDYSDTKKKKNAVMRFYIYDKAAKEGLNFTVTRAELKLQNRFFLNNGFSLDSIVKAHSKYRLYHFNHVIQKQYVMDEYQHYRDIKHSDLCMLDEELNRVDIDIKVIDEFIKQVQSAYVDFYGNVV